VQQQLNLFQDCIRGRAMSIVLLMQNDLHDLCDQTLVQLLQS